VVVDRVTVVSAVIKTMIRTKDIETAAKAIANLKLVRKLIDIANKNKATPLQPLIRQWLMLFKIDSKVEVRSEQRYSILENSQCGIFATSVIDPGITVHHVFGIHEKVDSPISEATPTMEAVQSKEIGGSGGISADVWVKRLVRLDRIAHHPFTRRQSAGTLKYCPAKW
jgi:hypothetical protein